MKKTKPNKGGHDRKARVIEIKPETASDLALEFIRDYAGKHRGTVAELARRLTARVGFVVHRQTIEGWIHEDPAKRIQPLAGMALILMIEAQQMALGGAYYNPLAVIQAKLLKSGSRSESPHRFEMAPPERL